jgi:hypothetical protein
MIKLRHTPVITKFSEGDKVTLKKGRQGKIYRDGWGNTAYKHDDGIVYVYFFPKERRSPDYVEQIPLHDFHGVE